MIEGYLEGDLGLYEVYLPLMEHKKDIVHGLREVCRKQDMLTSSYLMVIALSNQSRSRRAITLPLIPFGVQQGVLLGYRARAQ